MSLVGQEIDSQRKKVKFIREERNNVQVRQMHRKHPSPPLPRANNRTQVEEEQFLKNIRNHSPKPSTPDHTLN